MFMHVKEKVRYVCQCSRHQGNVELAVINEQIIPADIPLIKNNIWVEALQTNVLAFVCDLRCEYLLLAKSLALV